MRVAGTRRLAAGVFWALLSLSATGRTHWHRADQQPTDAATAAVALAACEAETAPGGSEERAVARCMARRGYFSWDGV